MSALENMEPTDVAAWVAKAGAVLVAKDPVMAAATFSDLHDRADAALGQKVVARRLGMAHGKNNEIELLTKRIAARHAITVTAIQSNRRSPHIVHAKRHLAHALHHRLHLSFKDVGRALGCNRTTAMRQANAWDAYLERVKK